MNKPKFIFLIHVFFLAGLMSPAISFAQSDDRQETRRADPSYEVVLQILIASNSQTPKNNVPQTLSNVVKKLKTNYTFSDYRLVSTYLERTTDAVEHKSIFSEFSPNQSITTPVFSNWTLNGLQNLPSAKGGGNLIQFQNFAFGARVPVLVSAKTQDGKESPASYYEQIGLTIRKFSLTSNVPTVIGSLSTSKPEELMFLILTVKPAED